MSSGKAGETRINQIYDRVSDSVVSIQAQSGGGGATGSGFVVSADGTIVTNDHVVEDAEQVQVALRRHRRGRRRRRVIGTDPSSDLAVLQGRPGRRAGGSSR